MVINRLSNFDFTNLIKKIAHGIKVYLPDNFDFK